MSTEFNYNTNNMFIWDFINNIVSTKQLFSEFKNNIDNLRYLYNNYIQEIKLICAIKLFNKLFTNITRIIQRTEVIVNYLYYHKWNIKNMSMDKLIIFISTISVYVKLDIGILNSNLDELNKFNKINPINPINTSKITKITNKIIKELKKLKIKSDQLL
jgi:hypothetical protein